MDNQSRDRDEGKEKQGSSNELISIISKEKMKLVAESKPENKAEEVALEQIENDLTANPDVADALLNHLSKTFDAAKDSSQPGSPDAIWSHVISSMGGNHDFTEKKADFSIFNGHGKKETLVAIFALSERYPTTTEGKPSHVGADLNPAVWSLGREIGHNGKGSFYFTEHSFNTVKNLYIASKTPQS